jgi:dipeptide/tripeptide permease
LVYFVLLVSANEVFEKVATFGLHANMILYLTERYHMTAATGTVVLYFWNALSNFLPIFGAVLSDSCLGRFRVIALGSVVSLAVSTNTNQTIHPSIGVSCAMTR